MARKWTEDEIETLKEKYPERGSDIPEIERSQQSIVSKANSLGLKKYPARRKEITDEELVEMRNEGMTYREIAEELGVSKSYLESRFQSLPKSSRLKKSGVKDLSEKDKAYIAGIVDGEGSIGLWKKTQSREDWSKTTVAPQIRVAMTSKETIDFISEKVGTGSYSHKHEQLENKEKQYIFAIQAQNEVRDFLEQIKPYLIEKKEQADLVIEYCEKREPHKPYTEDELAMVDQLKEMK